LVVREIGHGRGKHEEHGEQKGGTCENVGLVRQNSDPVELGTGLSGPPHLHHQSRLAGWG
jgi:hypothetical protein